MKRVAQMKRLVRPDSGSEEGASGKGFSLSVLYLSLLLFFSRAEVEGCERSGEPEEERALTPHLIFIPPPLSFLVSIASMDGYKSCQRGIGESTVRCSPFSSSKFHVETSEVRNEDAGEL